MSYVSEFQVLTTSMKIHYHETIVVQHGRKLWLENVSRVLIFRYSEKTGKNKKKPTNVVYNWPNDFSSYSWTMVGFSWLPKYENFNFNGQMVFCSNVYSNV